MPFYQCFKTKDRDVYCSSTEYRSHDEGKVWVAACMAHFGIRGSDMLKKPYPSEDQPEGAIIWP